MVTNSIQVDIMASAITTTATTLEGQLLEIINAVQIAELNSARNPNNTNAVPVATFNSETNVFNATISLPVSAQVSTTDGKLEVMAATYLTD